MSSHLLHHQQCPKCAAIGKDRNNDNLGIYSDGHHYCFSCGYFVPSDKIARFKRAQNEVRERDLNSAIALPTDVTTVIPTEAELWIRQYEIPTTTLKKHLVVWSERWQRLIFPYFINGELVAWQGRYFGDNPETKRKKKWFSQGQLDEILYVLNAKATSLCLVEDIVSAIKLEPYVAVSPLFGSVISNKRLLRIAKFYSNIIIWLDPDKQKEAMQFAENARTLGLQATVVLSSKDPKEHTKEEIEQYLCLNPK